MYAITGLLVFLSSLPQDRGESKEFLKALRNGRAWKTKLREATIRKAEELSQWICLGEEKKAAPQHQVGPSDVRFEYLKNVLDESGKPCCISRCYCQPFSFDVVLGNEKLMNPNSLHLSWVPEIRSVPVSIKVSNSARRPSQERGASELAASSLHM